MWLNLFQRRRSNAGDFQEVLRSFVGAGCDNSISKFFANTRKPHEVIAGCGIGIEFDSVKGGFPIDRELNLAFFFSLSPAFLRAGHPNLSISRPPHSFLLR